MPVTVFPAPPAAAPTEAQVRAALALSAGPVDVNGQNIIDAGIIRYAGDQFSDYLSPGLVLERTGPNAPDLEVFRDGLTGVAFAGTGAAEEAGFTAHILHDIEAGTTPTFHIHWSHKIAAPVGSVRWQIEITAARGYGAGAYPASVVIGTTQAAPAQYVHAITDDDDLPIPAALAAVLEPDMLLKCRVFRDPAHGDDDFENDAFLDHIDLHYVIGQSATSERNRPFTSGGF